MANKRMANKQSADKLHRLNLSYSEQDPTEILSHALNQAGELGIAFSGAEDVVLIDMASRIRARTGQRFRVFCLDTGRLHKETYEFIETVRKRYEIDIEICFPEAEAVIKLTKEKGLFSFYEDSHKECCAIRKVQPLRKKLATLDAWVTGQRKDQNPNTRDAVPVIQLDASFRGKNQQLIKYNPLANWRSEDVWHYIHTFNVPYNALHQQGFASIGCEPCTRAVLPNQHEREGRWWWEDANHKECGLHQSNMAAPDDKESRPLKLAQKLKHSGKIPERIKTHAATR